KLREDPRYKKLPVRALTAKAMPGDREKALEAGCLAVVTKPNDRNLPGGVLDRWLPRDEDAPSAARTPPTGTGSRPAGGRPARKPRGPRALPRAPGPADRPRDLRRGGAPGGAASGVRAHPARRAAPGHERLRGDQPPQDAGAH